MIYWRQSSDEDCERSVGGSIGSMVIITIWREQRKHLKPGQKPFNLLSCCVFFFWVIVGILYGLKYGRHGARTLRPPESAVRPRWCMAVEDIILKIIMLHFSWRALVNLYKWVPLPWKQDDVGWKVRADLSDRKWYWLPSCRHIEWWKMILSRS